jgi:hypothetical protein
LNDLLYTIAAQLRPLTHGEVAALVGDFVGGLGDKRQTRFLN